MYYFLLILSTSYMYIMSCDSHSSCVSLVVFITPILLRGKLRHGEVKQLSELSQSQYVVALGFRFWIFGSRVSALHPSAVLDS